MLRKEAIELSEMNVTMIEVEKRKKSYTDSKYFQHGSSQMFFTSHLQILFLLLLVF